MLKAIKKLYKIFIVHQLYNFEKLRSYFLFYLHQKLVSIKFNQVNGDFIEFVLSDALNNSLKNYLDDLFDEFAGIDENKRLNEEFLNDSKYSPLILNQIIINKFLKRTHSNFALDPFHPVVLQLFEELKFHIKDFIGSPYAIVNSRVWKTYPNADYSGPNSLHTDFFEPGHLKIMIYPDGFNGNNGGFYLGALGRELGLPFPDGLSSEGQNLPLEKLDGINFNSAPNGFSICFKNSNIIHSGIPGKLEDRLSIEITLQRTFAYLPQINKSSIHGRHFKGVFDVYTFGYQNKKRKI